MNACPEADSFMVELKIDVFQDVKAMKEHGVDIEMTTIIDMAEEMICKLREDIETSWQVHEGRLTKINNTLLTKNGVWSRASTISFDIILRS